MEHVYCSSLLPSGNSQGRPRIWPSWFKAFLRNLPAAGHPAVSRTSLARQRVCDDNHPAVTVVPLTLGRWWGFNSMCVNNYQKGAVR